MRKNVVLLTSLKYLKRYFFVFIYTILYIDILISAPDIYNAVFFIYYIGMPLSILYVYVDLHLPTHGNVYFDVSVMYFLGVIQYGLIGWGGQRIYYVVKKWFLDRA